VWKESRESEVKVYSEALKNKSKTVFQG